MIVIACAIFNIMNKEEMYMKLALEEAAIAKEEDEVPIGCVIVCEDKVIAKTHNRKEIKNNAIFHAEIEAILEASRVKNNWNLSDCELYVTLEPCMMCTGAIVNSRIEKVVFGAPSHKAGCLITKINLLEVNGLNHYPKIVSSVLEKECAQLLSEYFKQKRMNHTK